MMHPASVQALAQARHADLHHQAQRDALARAARQASRTPSQPPDQAPGILAALTGWVRGRPEPGSS